MWKGILLAAAALPLAGCATQFLEAAERECSALALDGKDHADCVQASYGRRMARLQSIQQGLSSASAIHNSGMPAAPPATPAPIRPARFLQSSYINGMNRICVYNTLNGTEITTISSMQFCPLQ